MDPKAIQIRTALSLGILVLFLGLSLWWIGQVQRGPTEGALPRPLRKAQRLTRAVVERLRDTVMLVPVFDKSQAVARPRVNGSAGMGGPSDTVGYRFALTTGYGGDTLASYSMAELRALPFREIVYDFKCIEGWSQRTWWGGVRFSDFLRAQKVIQPGLMPGQKGYLGLASLDGGYQVGLDMKTALHPQTLLCWEMNGKSLPANQGAPLRLIVPTQYGVKSIKKIGTFYLSAELPKDYWVERGYAFDLGH